MYKTTLKQNGGRRKGLNSGIICLRPIIPIALEAVQVIVVICMGRAPHYDQMIVTIICTYLEKMAVFAKA